jgi:CheY-like chemotaxis protein
MPHILLVEDHKIVAQAVKETLELEGWRVTLCGDGDRAVGWLASNAKYDLMMLDNHLPNLNGLEIVRYARGLDHRQGMPILGVSKSDKRQNQSSVPDSGDVAVCAVAAYSSTKRTTQPHDVEP